MKNRKIALYIVLAFAVVLNSSCNKEVDHDENDQPLTKLRMADANADITANYLINSVYLAGHAKPYYPGKIIISSTWKQIEGPTTASIENPNALITKVTALQTGVYSFEVTVYDDARHYDIDTMTLKIENSGAAIKELLFSNIPWTTVETIWSESWLEIGNIHTYIPPNTVFEIFIRREISPGWHQIIPAAQNTTNSGYVYSLSAGTNPILRIDELPEVYNRDRPDIKIVF